MCAIPLAIAFMLAYPFPAIPYPKTVHSRSKSDTEAHTSRATAYVNEEWPDRITVRYLEQHREPAAPLQFAACAGESRDQSECIRIESPIRESAALTLLPTPHYSHVTAAVVACVQRRPLTAGEHFDDTSKSTGTKKRRSVPI